MITNYTTEPIELQQPGGRAPLLFATQVPYFRGMMMALQEPPPILMWQFEEARRTVYQLAPGLYMLSVL